MKIEKSVIDYIFYVLVMVFLCFVIYIAGILVRIFVDIESRSNSYSFITEQGDRLKVTVKTPQYGDGHILEIDEKEDWVASFEAVISPEYPAKSKKIAKGLLDFVEEKDGCRYYSVCGLEYIVYSKAAPHVITKDGEWCQIRFIRNLDTEYHLYENWIVYVLLYEYEGNTATELYGERIVGWIKDSPEVSEKELIDSLPHVPDNYEELEEMILQSSLLEFD